MAQHQHYRSPFGDTTFTKVFVGGLAWETPTDVMRSYFQQFGEILEAVIITDKHTGKSKGYGFVTFRDPDSARRACIEANPVIDGRRANCNVASLGRPRPSPPRGRAQVGNMYQGQGGAGAYQAMGPQPVPAGTTPVMYPPYGYTAAYPPDYAYHQTMYNHQYQQAQYYNQLYGASSSSIGAPYYYAATAPGGYSLQAAAGARGNFPVPAAQRFQGPSYLYYPTQTPMEGATGAYNPASPHPLTQPPRFSFPASTDSMVPPQTSAEVEAGPTTSTSSTA